MLISYYICCAQAPDWGIDGDMDGDNDDYDPSSTQSPLPCPATGNAFLPHRDNCNAFFACSSGGYGQQTLLNCAPGLHFDHERQLCDLPRSARCWARENPPIPGQSADQDQGGSFPPGGEDDIIDGMNFGKPGAQRPNGKPSGQGPLPPSISGPLRPGQWASRPRAAGATDAEDDAEIISAVSLEN